MDDIGNATADEPVPVAISVGELSLPEESFDPSAHAEISPWWTVLQAIAWVTTRSPAFVERVGQLEAHNEQEIAQFICSSMVLVYVSRNACACPAKSLDSTNRWESCTCFRDAGRLILEQIRQGHLSPIQTVGGVSRTMAFHEFAGIGQRPSGADWHDLKPAPIFSSAEVIAAFPHEVPSGQSAITFTSTALAENECRDWLAEEFAADPDRRRTKPDFQSAALARFSGRLSKRGFIRAWDAVASDAGRSKPGRKS